MARQETWLVHQSPEAGGVKLMDGLFFGGDATIAQGLDTII